MNVRFFPRACRLLLLTIVVTGARLAHGIILLNTGDPTVNTTEPTGALAGSGWQYEGQWGGFLGTPIAPHFFASAEHIGRAGAVFVYGGSSYTIDRSFAVPGTDLIIWKVIESFPAFAPLYTKNDEAGKPLVVFGRGTDRGSDVLFNSELRGWLWGAENHIQRWGENTVAEVFPYQPAWNVFLYATFDQSGGTNEAHLSSGDSGGAVFLNDNGTWKLAAINYAVDGPLFTDSSGGGQFQGALFDARGFYSCNVTCQLIDGASRVPTGFYSTAISAQIPAIYSILDPTGDPDGDGVSNLLEYALHLDPLVPDAAGLPQLSRSSGNVSLTYTRANQATDLRYTVEQSSDLVNWSAVTTQDRIVSNQRLTQVIEATVPASGETLFLRLRVTRP